MRRRLEEALETVIGEDVPPNREATIAALTAVANILEREEALYQIAITDPDDDKRTGTRDNYKIGQLLQTVCDNDEALDTMISTMMREAPQTGDADEEAPPVALPPDEELSTAAARALMAASCAGWARTVVFPEQEERLYDWLIATLRGFSAAPAPPAPTPPPGVQGPARPPALRVFATGVLAMLTASSDSRGTVVSSGIAGPLVKRLREYYPIAGKLFSGPADSLFPTPARLPTTLPQRGASSPRPMFSLPASPQLFPASPQLGPFSPPRTPMQTSPAPAPAPAAAPASAQSPTPVLPGGLVLAGQQDIEAMDTDEHSNHEQEGHHDGAVDEAEEGPEPPDCSTDEIPTETLQRLEMRYLLLLLSTVGEYQEMVSPMFQEGGVDVLMSFMKSRNTYLLLDTLRLVGQLLAHKKFGGFFLDRGGLQLLLMAPHSPFMSGAIAGCFAGLGVNSSIIEQICLMPHPYPFSLVKLGIWLMGSESDCARKHICSFFSTSLPFRTLMELFDSMNGLSKLTNLLKALVSTDSRQTSFAAAYSLRQYFRAHFVHLCNDLRRSALRATSGEVTAPTPGYKAVNTDDLSLEEAAKDFERFGVRQTIPTYSGVLSPTPRPKTRWPFVDSFLKAGGVSQLLELMQKTPSWHFPASPDVIRYSADVLHVISFLPSTHSDILNTTTVGPPQQTGTDVLFNSLQQVSASPEALISVLSVICNCVCRQPIAHAQQRKQTSRAQHASTSEHTRDATAVFAAPQSAVGSEAQQPVAPGTPGRARSSQPVQEVDDMLRRVWRNVRNKNGIQMLLSLVRYIQPKSMEHVDRVRARACEALAGLSRDPMITQILGKLQVCSLLSDRMEEPVLPQTARYHEQFRKHAIDIIGRITGRPPATLMQDATDPAHRKIERAAIVSQTHVSYSQNELLAVVHDFLASKGYKQSADTLAKEANLADLPEGSSTGMLDEIVTQYLRNQHEKCRNPIAVLPPFPILKPHKCPERRVFGPVAGVAPVSITTRLMERQLCPRFGGHGGRSCDRKLLYSRFKPFKSYHNDESLFTCSAFLTDKRIIVGTSTGEFRLYNTENSDPERAWNGHEGGQVAWLKLSPDRKRMVTSTTESRSYAETKLWDVSDPMNTNDPLRIFPGVYAAHFSSTGDRLVGTYEDKACVFDVESGDALLTLAEHVSSAEINHSNVACWSPCDSLVLNDGVLWDLRIPQVVHRFDKFTSYGSGYFNRSGNEVIINSEIWDLRSLKLVKTVPVLDQTHLIFSGTGDIAFALCREYDKTSKRQRASVFSKSFHTVDMTDYSLITTANTGDRFLWSLSIDEYDTQICTVENTHNDTSSTCRLYEVGRKRLGDTDDFEDEPIDEEEEELLYSDEESGSDSELDDEDLYASDTEESDDDGEHDDDDDDDVLEGIEIFEEGADGDHGAGDHSESGSGDSADEHDDVGPIVLRPEDIAQLVLPGRRRRRAEPVAAAAAAQAPAAEAAEAAEPSTPLGAAAAAAAGAQVPESVAEQHESEAPAEDEDTAQGRRRRRRRPQLRFEERPSDRGPSST
eukprot:m51a1_g11884 putative protein vprbp (1539) ;mRNA; r:579303-584970